MATILLGHDIRHVEWPEGCKNANDILVLQGEGRIAQYLSDARRVDRWLYTRVA